MRLLDLDIHGFGKFKGRSVSLKDGINIIYGKNEAGKSTIHTFIQSMLYGIERGRGRAAKNDLYSRFEPWSDRGTYEGTLRLESQGMIYRIERTFQKNSKSLRVINETLGREEEPCKELMDQFTGGLSETAYSNTISIGQLKSATDEGMVAELRNYIANLNTSGDMELNISKAVDLLKSQKKELEGQMEPEAARNYAALVGEIRNLDKELADPAYENQLPEYRRMQESIKDSLAVKQEEKEKLLQRSARAKQALTSGMFEDQESIDACRREANEAFEAYQKEGVICRKKFRTVLMVALLVAGSLLLGEAASLVFVNMNKGATRANPNINFTVIAGVIVLISLVCYLMAFLVYRISRSHKRALAKATDALKEKLSRHLEDADISERSMSAFNERMDEFTDMSSAVSRSEAAIAQLTDAITSLHKQQENCTALIETQQKLQWELDQKLERLAGLKNQADVFKQKAEENDRLREEVTAIDLAIETITSLSASIRDSFGLYLNKAASRLLSGITGGIYNSMSVDENLNVFLNTRTKLVPLEQVSRGTIDQVYLALRLAAAKLIQNNLDEMPLVFDDSFALYDEDRLRTALRWLAKAYHGQILIFTCHQREAQMLTANQIDYHLFSI